MKIAFFTGILLTLVNLSIVAQSDTTYINPVIPGDHPDATLTRIGNDFYTTGSSFNVTPVIYHSTDLVHWEAIAQPVSASWSNYGDSPGGGCWGGQMVFYNGKYWDYFSRANQMYFVTATDPKGPWSSPVKVNNPSTLPYGLGYDNSIFIDTNGKWYLVVKNGQPNNGIVELGNDGQPTGVVYNLSWLNPAPSYPYSWAEGPVMWKYKGYYYYCFAHDLSGGEKVMRSDSLTDNQSFWTTPVDFFNLNDPLVYTSKFTGPNHNSAVVTLDDSTFWIIHPLYAKGEWKGQGRQGLLNQVHYDTSLIPVADYPVNRAFTAPKLPSSGIPWMVPKSDFFTSDTLDPEWSFLGYTADNTHSLTDRPGWLHLSPKSSSEGNTVLKNDGEHNYSLITRLEFDPQSTKDEAGLQIMRGDQTQFVKLYSSVNQYNHKVLVFSYNNTLYETDNTIGNILWFKMVRVNHSIRGYYSKNGYDWVQIGSSIDISAVDSYSDFSTFTGTRQGLFVQGRDAYFDLYIYRDAYTPILAECPANQFGTVPTTKTNGIYQLDSINNNDWALYAGVEFGNSEYPRTPKTIEITASSGGSGGTVEVHLDSINGTKIADCVVSSTGDWNTFKTFSSPVSHVQGRHDIYLVFKGASAGRLFKLEWIKFVSQAPPGFVSASLNSSDTLLLKLSSPVMTPALPSGLSIEANGSQNISIFNVSLAPGDSSSLIVTLNSGLTNTDSVTISYTPGTIMNSDSIGLLSFSGLGVDNMLPGAVPKIKLLSTKDNGDTIWMYVSKKMDSPASYASDFTINIGGQTMSASSAGLMKNDSSVLFLLPASRIYYEDDVTLSYNGTGLQAFNGGTLATFKDKPVQNTANGYPPQIVSAVIKPTGIYYKTLDLTFDKPLVGSSVNKSFFTITLNDQPVTIGTLTTNNDMLTFIFNPYVQPSDTIKISYSGGNVKTLYNGKLQDFSNYIVPNTVPGAGIREALNDKNSTLTVFPNPASNYLQISWKTAFSSLSVLSTDGKVVFHQLYDIPVQNTSISVNLVPGPYIIMVRNKNTTETKKVIIQ